MTLDELDQILSEAAKLVDTAAQGVTTTDLPEKKDHLHSLGSALGLIFEVQSAIYGERPDLEPAYLREKSPYPPGEARRYGEIFLKAVELSEAGDIEAAIQLLRSYLKQKPHEYFRAMAEQQLRRMEARRDAGA